MAVPLRVEPPPMADDLPPDVAVLCRALDALVGLDPRELAAGDTVIALQRQLSRLEAVMCRQATAFDVRKDWRDTSAENATAWIATHTRAPRRRVARGLRIGRALDAVALVDDAFARGAISVDHVDLLVAARARSHVTATAFARDEATLVGWAIDEPFHRFRLRLDEWLLWADEDAAEALAAKQRDGRRFHLSQSYENQWFGDLTLDPTSGDILNQALTAITDELFALDWKSATDALGERPTGAQLAELTRTPAQRRADAIVEMAARAMRAPAGGRAPQPLFTVLVGEETFARVCELASGTVVTPGALAPWLDDALIERVVFDGPDRVIGVSHRRSFEGALRRAIQVRDRGCTDPYCDKPASACQVDHIRPWALGGVTGQRNGRLQCGFHNLRRNGLDNGRFKRPGSGSGSGPGDATTSGPNDPQSDNGS